MPKARVALLFLADAITAFVARLVVAFVLGGMYLAPPAEMEQLGRSFSVSNSLANPYVIPTGLSAHHAPIYPVLLGLPYKIFGFEAPSARMATAAINLGFGAVAARLLPWVVWEAGLPVIAGVIGSGFVVVPFRIMKELRWETTRFRNVRLRVAR